MPTERITVDGREVTTLKELLRPGLRIVVVGINPSPVSVRAGHYYQGRLGRRFWQRFQHIGAAANLPRGGEDEEAFRQSVGFADLVRYPTPNARTIGQRELAAALPDLRRRVHPTGCRRLLFVFRAARNAAAPLERDGYELLSMPAPYASQGEVATALAALRRWLGQ